MEKAKKYIEEHRNVTCCICGKDVYCYQDFIFSKSGKKYNFVHKGCLKRNGDKNGV